MVFVRIEVRGDDNSIAELASSKRLLRLLTVRDAIEFDEYLIKKNTSFHFQTI